MYKHVLVAVGTSFSRSALTEGVGRARGHGARLTALHVVDEMPWWAVAAASYDLGQTIVAIGEHSREVVRHSNEQLKSAGVNGETRIVRLRLSGMSVGHAIADAAHNLDADLIVVGAGKGSSWRFWEERVIDGILRNSDRAVLIVNCREKAKGPGNPPPASAPVPHAG